jgi:hypothetical protein
MTINMSYIRLLDVKGWDVTVEHVACFCEHSIEYLGSIKLVG